jgi:hypothetical protein
MKDRLCAEVERVIDKFLEYHTEIMQENFSAPSM